jgi:hypothetical protein
MPDRKPTTALATASLISGILGFLASLALLAMLKTYGEEANRSAGVGIILAGAHWLLAAAFGLLGMILGVVALVRIRTGEYEGRRRAWTGILLGCFPFAFPCILFGMSDSNPLLRGSGRPALVAVASGSLRYESWNLVEMWSAVAGTLLLFGQGWAVRLAGVCLIARAADTEKKFDPLTVLLVCAVAAVLTWGINLGLGFCQETARPGGPEPSQQPAN